MKPQAASKLDKPGSNLTGFIFLNISQFFGAANDNLLKQVIVFGVAAGGIWANVMGEGAQAYVSLCLAVPFVVLSGFAGQFSDRYSKRHVAIAVKMLEIVIALVAAYGFVVANVWIVLAAMILISVQSTFFTPAKFGILPEIMDEAHLSRANGTINMFTYIAVILGGAIGGPIYDSYAPDTSWPNAAFPGAILLVVAILGTAATLGVPRLRAQDPKLKIKFDLFGTYIATWREIRRTALQSVIVAWSLFYMIVGGVAILILPDYKSLLGISATRTAMLMALLGICIGVGDYAAGRVSGHRIRPGLIPIGAIGTTVLFFALAVIPLNFAVVLSFLALTGFLAGFVMVPLQTMTQHLASTDQRGQVLGLWSCLSFVGVIAGNLLFLAVKQTGIPSNRIFALCGLLGLVFLALYYSRWQNMFARAVAEHHHET